MVRPTDQPERSQSQDFSDLSDSDDYDGHDEDGSAVAYLGHEQEYAPEWDEPIDVDSVRLRLARSHAACRTARD